MNYQISRATDSDLPLMQRLFYQTVTIYGSKIFTKEEVKIFSRLALDKKHWIQKFTEDFVYNAKLNGEVVGSFSLSKDGVIEYIFVHQNYQGRGIAKELYKTLENVAEDANIEVLTTRINISTRDFFKKNGFEIIKSIEKVAGGEDIVTYNGVKNL
ncbi:GNAT family N-acetyltransferase [Aquimarina sp. BL5]|uniref:GNAT family N-acetyltransferase n=1 Tax=Aquimarina sp. BL5 TaxID=1714860 RepID=UPI000E49FA4D|nr:GNAT family N-acetyltransferase [Aquimarina sp. BL5]AXT53006.1 GNAT family N-acetyltransferase [Aquimarina sp. BL5]RKN07333.1 GNAT family N-acetyltransferase [Aquimarina sp. BL5]